MDLTEIGINQTHSWKREAQRFAVKVKVSSHERNPVKIVRTSYTILVIGNAIINSGHEIQCAMGIVKKRSVATGPMVLQAL